MSAGIVHEINQPLNAIKLIVDGMLYWQNKGRMLEMDTVTGNLKKISAGVKRVDDIIKHMRAFANVSQNTELVPSGINETVSGALDILDRQLSVHCIEVKKHLSAKVPKMLANPNRLEEMVINIIINAMQALDGVERAVKEISVHTYFKAGKVTLEIADNATGIRQEIIEHI